MTLSRTKRNEELRKLAHISIGVSIAVVSVYIDRWWVVAALGLGLVMDVVLRSRSHWIHAMIDVGRRSYGDYSYVIGIAFVAVLFEDAPVFIGAVLILALADGLAGLIGRIFGVHHYHFFGADKTFLGSTVFFATSYIITMLILANEGVSANDMLWQSGAVAVVLTAVEGVVGFGLDNFAVPLAAGGLLALVI